MDEAYRLLGVEPGCGKKALRRAYEKKLRKLRARDMPAREALASAYAAILSELAGKDGVQLPPATAYETETPGRLQRFGLLTLLAAVGIVAGANVLYALARQYAPQLFPGSPYPQLARVYSGEFWGNCLQLGAYAAAILLAYVPVSLRRRSNGLRRLSPGFFLGAVLLALGFFFPHNCVAGTVSTVMDYSAMREGRLQVSASVPLVQAGDLAGPYGLPYRAGKSGTLYFPEQLVKGQNAAVHQATVTYLPHTRAVAKVQARAVQQFLCGQEDTAPAVRLRAGELLQTAALQRDSATLRSSWQYVSGGAAPKQLQTDLRAAPLTDRKGKPLVAHLPKQPAALLQLTDHNLLACFAAQSESGEKSCVAALVDYRDGRLLRAWRLKGEAPYQVYRCGSLLFLFTQGELRAPVPKSECFLQLFSVEENRIVFTADGTLAGEPGKLPHVYSFDPDGVLMAQKENGDGPLGKFVVPKTWMP